MNIIDKGIITPSEIYFATASNLAGKLFFSVPCTGHFYYTKLYSLHRENYHSYLIMYLLNGSATVYNEGHTYFVRKGDMAFLDCYHSHGYKAEESLETIWLHFDGVNAADYYKELSELNGCVVTPQDSYQVINYMNRILSMHSSGKKIDEALQSAYISRILAEFFVKNRQMEKVGPSLIEDTVAYINEHYTENLSLKELARMVSLSEFYFSRLFKKETGYTIHEYITKTRITNAKILLKSTKLSLKEIADLCGFSNESSFSNTFKKNTLVTPGVFRNTML